MALTEDIQGELAADISPLKIENYKKKTISFLIRTIRLDSTHSSGNKKVLKHFIRF